MRREYYLQWIEALDDEEKPKPFVDMYAISAFNEFAVYQHDFRREGGEMKGEIHSHPVNQASAQATKDVEPKSRWRDDTTRQTGKDKLALIPNIRGVHGRQKSTQKGPKYELKSDPELRTKLAQSP
jgi:hypothetical protein